MKTAHVILRSRTTAPRGAFGALALEAAATALRSEVDELNPGEAARLRRQDGVLGVAPAMPMRLVAPRVREAATPEAAGDVAWGVRAVRADTASTTGAGIVVAVLDTGIDPAHPAFSGVELVTRNFTDEPDADDDGHGTHCAGTIFGRRVGSTRIGVAPGVGRALIGKVLGAHGGSSRSIVDAILWAADGGANVISMSLGMDFTAYAALLQEQGLPAPVALSRALEGYRANVRLFERLVGLVEARQQATLVVAAAGNESDRDRSPDFEIGVSPPANAAGIVSVAALGRSSDGLLDVAGFSNTGALVAGPGVGIVSAGRGGGLESMSGTSMATPHVAGVAALWAERLQAQGNLTQANLMGHLVGRAGFAGLRPGIDPADVGAGLALAPQE